MRTRFILLVVSQWACAQARPEFVARLPNANAINGVRAIGHANSNGGGPLNAFGRAFQAAGFQWTPALCAADSDGDGATNGEELGDPCCDRGAAAGLGHEVTHPGAANDFTPSQLEMRRCHAAAAAATTTTKTNEPTHVPTTLAPTRVPDPVHPSSAPPPLAVPSSSGLAAAEPEAGAKSGSLSSANTSASGATQRPTPSVSAGEAAGGGSGDRSSDVAGRRSMSALPAAAIGLALGAWLI